jgi:hypothetical protein
MTVRTSSKCRATVVVRHSTASKSELRRVETSRCDIAREQLQDAVVCEDQLGKHVTWERYMRGKRSAAEAQFMLDSKQPDIDSRTAGTAQLQVQQATDVDEMSIDPPTSSNNVTNPSPVPEAQGSAKRVYGSGAWRDRNAVLAAESHKSSALGTKGAGAHTLTPCNARASKKNHIEARQRLDGDVNRRKQSPQQEQVPKRQKLLTEGLVVSIPNHQPGGKPARKAHDPKQTPTQDETYTK